MLQHKGRFKVVVSPSQQSTDSVGGGARETEKEMDRLRVYGDLVSPNVRNQALPIKSLHLSGTLCRARIARASLAVRAKQGGGRM